MSTTIVEYNTVGYTRDGYVSIFYPKRTVINRVMAINSLKSRYGGKLPESFYNWLRAAKNGDKTTLISSAIGNMEYWTMQETPTSLFVLYCIDKYNENSQAFGPFTSNEEAWKFLKQHDRPIDNGDDFVSASDADEDFDYDGELSRREKYPAFFCKNNAFYITPKHIILELVKPQE